VFVEDDDKTKAKITTFPDEGDTDFDRVVNKYKIGKVMVEKIDNLLACNIDKIKLTGEKIKNHVDEMISDISGLG